MFNTFPIGLILLGVLLILMLFGVTQRVFDKMKLSTLWSILFIVAVGIGVFIPVIRAHRLFSFSIGGFIIPMILCIYMLIKMGFTADMARAWIATIVTAGAVVLIYTFIPTQTTGMKIFAAIVVGIIAGAVSYLIGRSRRGALFSAIMGVYIGQTVNFLIDYFGRGITTAHLALGVGAMFDALVIASLSAFLLAIIVGETRERIITRTHTRRDFGYETGEFEEYDEAYKHNYEYDEHNRYHDHFDD